MLYTILLCHFCAFELTFDKCFHLRYYTKATYVKLLAVYAKQTKKKRILPYFDREINCYSLASALKERSRTEEEGEV